MLKIHEARDRAVRFSIKTGHMPDINLIHSMQRYDGYEPCFGRVVDQCPRVECRWHSECTALAKFQPADHLYRPVEYEEVRSQPTQVLGLRDKTQIGASTKPVRRPPPSHSSLKDSSATHA